jgi:hypothetical protein
MKPRITQFCLALCAVAACSLGGRTLSLGGTQALSEAGTVAGVPDASSSSGGDSGSAAAGSGSAGTLNVVNNEPVPCAAGHTTSVSGTVWDPAGKTQLYNAVVYIPPDDGQLPAFNQTVACEKCAASVPALAATLSGPDGSFTLDTDVPNTPSIDLVVQVGKWRRRQSVKITPCQANPLTDPNQTRLPRNRLEGDLPKIALSTGHSDALECLLLKIGISPSEFTTDSGPGRVSMFVGCTDDQSDKHTGAAKFSAALGGGSFPSTNQLFDTAGELDKYDAVIFSCEGHKCTPGDATIPIQTPEHIAQLVDFANRGGRVYLDHDHYNWLNHAGDTTGDRIEAAAQFSSSPDGVPSPLAGTINTVAGFYKGQDFAKWLVAVNASSTLGQLDLFSGKTSVESIDPNRAQSWIYRDPTQTWPDFFYFTIGTPVAQIDGDPAPEACGRVVFTDLHVSKSGGGCEDGGVCGESDDISDQDMPFPTGCTSVGLLPQEKALEFMIFDLTSCVQKETAKPTPPIVVK